MNNPSSVSGMLSKKEKMPHQAEKGKRGGPHSTYDRLTNAGHPSAGKKTTEGISRSSYVRFNVNGKLDRTGQGARKRRTKSKSQRGGKSKNTDRRGFKEGRLKRPKEKRGLHC